jgi:GTP-sensing pleiotropic transcriptional regulator CodY
MDTDNEILDFMNEYGQRNGGRLASLQEIADGVEGINHRSSVLYALRRLEERGKVVSLGRKGSSRRWAPTVEAETVWP